MRIEESMKRSDFQRQRGMTILGMILVIIMVAFVALIGMKVIPMYIQYYSIKSTIESVRKEPMLAQWTPTDIQKAIDRRFTIGYVENVKASDLKIRNERNIRVLELKYDDERELFYGLYVMLKVNEVIPLNP
ncbi:MAG: DUF4845 domain-containing protein [Candidatus Competibacteraceae bacterium]|nr:MAG: DUF4845 domain-containing protein [Candidatus Competibacteraceae bacterium]